MDWNPYPFKLYVKRLPIGAFFGTGLLLNTISWVWLTVRIPHSADQLFLHYNILFGVNYIGPAWRVFLVPGVGLIILLINFLLGWFVYQRDAFIAQLLNAIAVICQVFLLIATYLLIFLNV